jgi:hypothetical protein
MRIHLLTVTAALLLTASLPSPAADKTATDVLNDYLVDINGGSVSAAGLVGLDKGVTQIETSQDLIMAFQPVASGSNKSTFGVAVTPARTALMPMSGATYLRNDAWRLLGSLTLSYAQNKATLSGVDYDKAAFSLGTVYYFSKEDDPIAIGNRAFKDCITPEIAQKNAADIDAIVKNTTLSKEAKQAALDALTAAADKPLSSCIDETLKKEARWNAPKASLTYGQARIEQSGGDSYTLAKTATLNVQYGIGTAGLLAASIRYTHKGLELASLGSAGGPTYKTSSLLAARYTYGDQEGTAFRTILEASNARSSSPSVNQEAFIYAFGLDKKVSPGIWLELRVGRNRSLEDGKEQTTTLMNLNFSPSLMQFKL